MTAANPCVLAMVPLMVGYVAGQNVRGVGRSFLLSLTFSIGLTIMFAILFMATWAASSVLRAECEKDPRFGFLLIHAVAKVLAQRLRLWNVRLLDSALWGLV